MGRYFAVPVLGLAAALTASLIPQAIDFLVALLGLLTPAFNNTRGQLSLVMLFVICWSIHADLTESLIWGVVGGLALDLLSALPLGATSLALAALAFAVNSMARQLFPVRLIFLIAIAPLATMLLMAYALVLLALMGYSYALLDFAQLVLVPSMLLNGLAVIPVYALTRLVQRRLEGGLQIAPQSLASGSAARSDA